MEILTLLLSSVISLIAPTGVVVDRVIESQIRSQLAAVEQLHVRVDNRPSYQLVQGKIDRLRIAARGLFPIAEVRLEAFELETDPIQLNPSRLRRGKPELQQPLRAGMRLTLNAEDVNRAIRSPTVTTQLRKLGIGVIRDRDLRRQVQRYEIVNPRVEVLPDHRIRARVTLKEPSDPATLEIMGESGIDVVAGKQIRLVAPVVRVNGQPIPDDVTRTIAAGVFERSDLSQLEAEGVTARILHLQIRNQQIDLAAFVQLDNKR